MYELTETQLAEAASDAADEAAWLEEQGMELQYLWVGEIGYPL